MRGEKTLLLAQSSVIILLVQVSLIDSKPFDKQLML